MESSRLKTNPVKGNIFLFTLVLLLGGVLQAQGQRTLPGR